jgi:hypothetical protein
MSVLFLPYDIQVQSLDSITAPDYVVDIAESKAKVETRTLITSEPAGAIITVTIDDETDDSFNSLWDFYQLCRGNHRAFEIRPDHNLYQLFPCFARDRFLPYWRFDTQLVYGLKNNNIGLYGISVNFKNVLV